MIEADLRRFVPLLLAALCPTACGGTVSTPSSSVAGTYVSAHFSFQYTPLDASNIVETAAALEQQYDRILSDLGVSGLPPVHVTFYLDHGALEAATRPAAGVVPAWTAGLVTARDQIHLMSPNLPAWAPYQRMVSNLVHEFAHCVSLHLNARIANNPRWLWETVAVYEARQFVDPNALTYMRAHAPPTFDQLNSLDNTSVYDVGYLLGEFIATRWGQAALRELIAANGDTSIVLQLSLEDFRQQWFAFIAARYGL